MPLYNQGVTSITPSDTTLTIPTTTGAVTPAVNQAAAFNWTGVHTFGGAVTIDASAAIQLDVNTNFTVDDSGNVVCVDITAGGNISGANLSGTNTGDQTSIVGITGTMTEFNAAVSDGNILFNDEQGIGFRIENRTSDPGSPTVGQVWLRTDL